LNSGVPAPFTGKGGVHRWLACILFHHPGNKAEELGLKHLFCTTLAWWYNSYLLHVNHSIFKQVYHEDQCYYAKILVGWCS
jgi:hypothetical protein